MSGPPPYIPPPPPPPPPEGWAPPRPTSGKAIASLICGLVGFVVFCYLPGIAALVGVVLGILGLIETGRAGTRSGRGLAIAGLTASVLAVAANVAWIGLLVTMGQINEREFEQRIVDGIEQDQTLLLQRIQDYYQANEDSLGPGGPVLAPRGEGAARVTTELRVEHLAGENELRLRRRGAGWELAVTGQKTATLRATGWNGEVLREIEIRDAGRGNWVQTAP